MEILNLLESKQPGFAYSLFVSWEEIAEAFDLYSYWEFTNPDEAPDISILEDAFEEVNDSFESLSENLRVDLENMAIDSIAKHWSAPAVLYQYFDIKTLVNEVNKWSSQEPKNPNIFGKCPLPGTSISFMESEAGLMLTLYPAFEIPFVESHHELYMSLPEQSIDELTSWELAQSLADISKLISFDFNFDIYDWESRRSKNYLYKTTGSI